MRRIRGKVALASISISILAVTFAFVNYYGQIYEPSPLLNTGLKFWTRDPAKNLTRPYLWEVDIIKGPYDNVSIFPVHWQDRPSIGMKVFRDNLNSTTVWTTIHVRQDLRGQALDAIFRSTISLWVFPTFAYRYDTENKNPENTFGIEINDGTNLLWYVFSDSPSQVFQLPRHRIVLIETPLNVWSSRQINIARDFEAAGWATPQSISFILIVGTTWLYPGEWMGYFSGLTVDVAPLQTETLSLSAFVALLVVDFLVIAGLFGAALTTDRQRKPGASGARGRIK